MRIVINTCFGGFCVPEALCEAEGLSRYDDIERTDTRLVNFVETHADANGRYCEGCAELEVVEIPDTCTDWELSEYDGMESIIYVVDGKICHAS